MTLIFMRGGVILFPFLLNVLLARLLDPAAMGFWLLFFSVSGFLTVCIGMGAPLWAGHQAAVSLENKCLNLFSILKPAIYQIVVFFFLFLLLGKLFLLYFSSEYEFWRDYGIFSIVAATLLAVNALFCEMLRGLKRPVKALVLEAWPVAGVVLMVLLLFFSGKMAEGIDLQYLMVLFITVVGLGSFFSFFFLQNCKIESNDVHGKTGENTWILPSTWAIGFGNVILAVGRQADLWIVGWLLDAHQLAVYGLASRVAFVSNIAQSAARGALQAKIPVFFLRRDFSSLARLMHDTSHTNFRFSMLVLLAFFMFGAVLAEMLYGIFYKSIWGPCLILLAGRCIAAFLGQNALLLNLTGNSRQVLVSNLLWLFIFIPLLWQAVTFFGLFGAALVTSFYVSVIGFDLAFRVKGIFGFWPFAKVL